MESVILAVWNYLRISSTHNDTVEKMNLETRMHAAVLICFTNVSKYFIITPRHRQTYQSKSVIIVTKLTNQTTLLWVSLPNYETDQCIKRWALHEALHHDTDGHIDWNLFQELSGSMQCVWLKASRTLQDVYIIFYESMSRTQTTMNTFISIIIKYLRVSFFCCSSSPRIIRDGNKCLRQPRWRQCDTHLATRRCSVTI